MPTNDLERLKVDDGNFNPLTGKPFFSNPIFKSHSLLGVAGVRLRNELMSEILARRLTLPPEPDGGSTRTHKWKVGFSRVVETLPSVKVDPERLWRIYVGSGCVNDEIAAVHMWGIGRLEFAAQDLSNLGRQPPQHLVLGVDHIPARIEIIELGAIRLRIHTAHLSISHNRLCSHQLRARPFRRRQLSDNLGAVPVDQARRVVNARQAKSLRGRENPRMRLRACLQYPLEVIH